MKKLQKYGYTVLTALLLSSPAIAGDMDKMHSKAKAATTSFSTYDQNSNGQISYEELRANFMGNIPADVFQSYDVSNNGALDRNEFNKFIEKNYTISMNNQKEYMKTKQQNEMLKKQAAAENARLAKEYNEAQKMADAQMMKYKDRPKTKMTLDFVVLDQNNDDQIDAQEFSDYTNAAVDAEMAYGDFDTNNDGMLNISEFRKFVNSDPVIPARIKG